MVKYDLQANRDPRDPDLPIQYFARIVRGDYIGYDDLIRLISKMSSLNYGVIQGVLGTLYDVMEEQVRFGRTVQMGDLGTLFMTIQSRSASKAEEFDNGNIDGARIRFLPSKKLKSVIKGLTYEKVNGKGHQNGQTDDANEGKPATKAVRDVQPNQGDA